MYINNSVYKDAKLPMESFNSIPYQNLPIQPATEQQRERTSRAVPWFLTNMPVSTNRS
jgi:hypothetical protein